MEDKFYNFALRYLSYRPRSEKEVRDKLKVTLLGGQASEKLKVENSGQIIDLVIKKLIEKKFINDEEFAKGWIGSRQRFKPRSSRLIKMELKQKGIDPELIDKMINDEGLMINDLESAKKLVEKRIERFRKLPKQEVYQKLGRFLASKGFNWDTIKHSIDEVLGKGV